MRKIFLCLLFLLPFFSLAQVTVRVLDAVSGKVISNAAVYCDDELIATTNEQGSATFKTKCKNLEIEADFYDGTVINTTDNMTARLQPASERARNIQKIVIQDKSDERALRILDEVENHYKDNNPQSLDSYNFKSYSKISIDLDKDSVEDYRNFMNRRADSLAALPKKELNQTERDKKDSLMEEDLYKAVQESQFFMWEKAQLHQFAKGKGENVKILDSRISGLQNPIYEFIALSVSNLGRTPRILQRENRKLYRYYLTDTVDLDGRKNFVIKYRPVTTKKNANRRKFTGSLYIDQQTYGVKRIENHAKNAREGTMTANWQLISGKWFLVNEDIRRIAGTQEFDTKEKKKTDSKSGDKKEEQPKTDSLKTDGQKTFGNYIYIKNRFFDFETNIEQNASDFKGYTYQVKNADGSLLDQYRTEELTDREMRTYANIDSLTNKLGLEKKVNQLINLLKGKIRLGMVDFDISQLIKYNKYEGYRVGLGAKLNEKFHKSISPDAYVAYGFKDRDWKFGAGVDFRMSEVRNSILRVDYVKDVGAVGRFRRNTYNGLALISDLTSDLYNANFYSFQGFGASWEYDATNSLTVRFGANYQKQRALFDYQFRNQPNDYRDFKTSVLFKYSPKDRNIMTPSGKFTLQSGYPKFFLNLEHGVEAFDANMKYTRAEALAEHQFRTKAGTTNLKLYGGLSTDTAPIWKNFEVAGLTDGFSNSFLSRLNLESSFSFFTMPSGIFYADKFVGLHFTQHIPWTFKTIGKRFSRLEFKYSAAIGDFKNPQYHQLNFTPIDHLYQETGLIWRNFLGSAYSVGFHYRLGHYRTSNFDENYAVSLGLISF